MNNEETLPQKSLILDACSLISLYATGYFETILRCIPGQVYVASYVESIEVKDLYNPDTDNYDIPIDLQAVKRYGLIEVVKPAPGDEAVTAVNFAYLMSKKRPGKNTGEAITGAIALSRQWMMVTDDVDATDFFTNLPDYTIQTTTTLHVMRHWAQFDNPSRQVVQQALQKIRNHARYGPPPNAHPLLAWWQSYDIAS